METPPRAVAAYVDSDTYSYMRMYAAESTLRSKFNLFSLFERFWWDQNVDRPYAPVHVLHFVLAAIRRDVAAPLNLYFAVMDLLTAPPLDPKTRRPYAWLDGSGTPLKAMKKAEAAVRLAAVKREPQKAPPGYVPDPEDWDKLPNDVQAHISCWLCTGLRDDSYTAIQQIDINFDLVRARGKLEVRKDKVWSREGRTISFGCNCCLFPGSAEPDRRWCIFHADGGRRGLPKFPVDAAKLRRGMQALGWKGQTPRRTYAISLRRSAEQAQQHWNLDALDNPGWTLWSTFTGYTLDHDRNKQLVPTLGGWAQHLCTQPGPGTSENAFWPENVDEVQEMEVRQKDDLFLKEGMSEERAAQHRFMSVTEGAEIRQGISSKDKRAPRTVKKSGVQMLVDGSGTKFVTFGGKKKSKVKK